MTVLKLIIVDDNKQFRDGLRFYLEQILNHKVIAEAASGNEFLQLDKLHEANIVLMDISMPGQSGIEVTKQFFINHKGKVIAITSYEEKTYLNELIEAGINGCVFKKDIHDKLNIALTEVMKNKLYYPYNMSIKH